jgi:hypothetical protein
LLLSTGFDESEERIAAQEHSAFSHLVQELYQLSCHQFAPVVSLPRPLVVGLRYTGQVWQPQAKKPPTAAKVMTDEKAADAEGAQGRNLDSEQLVEQEALNPEMKGAAANSFSAAARLGQYTGDLPPEVEAS